MTEKDNDELTPEEQKKRIEFMLQEHVCKGANNAETWLTPGYKKIFWHVFDLGDVKRYTWINYCPYCGFKPEEPWW